MLGENAIRFFDLDRAALAEVAGLVGPSVADVLGRREPVDPERREHFDLRGGYLRPAEGDAKLDVVASLVADDADRIRATVSTSS
jgi:hypothetical protein